MFRTLEEFEEDEKRIIVKGIVIGILWATFKFCAAGIVIFAAGRYIGWW